MNNEYNPHGLGRNRFESQDAFAERVEQDARHQARREEQIDRYEIACSYNESLAADKRDDERRHPEEYDRDSAS